MRNTGNDEAIIKQVFNETKLTMKTRILIFSLLIVAIFTSCQKDESQLIKNEDCDNMLVFDSREDLYVKLSEVLRMTSEEKQIWFNERNFDSKGLMADCIYESVDPESFDSKNEIIEFVNENSTFIELIKNELEMEVDVVNANCPFRYFLNSQNEFQVGNEIYKLIDDIIYIVSIENIDCFNQFDGMPQNNLVEYRILKETRLKSVEQGCGTGSYAETSKKVDGRTYKVKLELSLYEDGVNGAGRNVISYFKILSRRTTLGVFWNYTNNISAQIKAKVLYQNEYYGQRDFSQIEAYSNHSDYKIEDTANEWSSPDPNWSADAYYEGYNCYATVPETDNATLNCNGNIF